MQQLTGLDAAFLYMETPANFGHVSGLSIFDPSTASEPLTLERVRTLMEDRLHLLPPLRRRLVGVPFGLDHPYWIEDPDFDIEYHVREIALPYPGDHDQLAAQVARIVGRPLDRSRPLWELYVISGLEGGYVAELTKMHHSSIDGASGTELMVTTLDLEPEPRVVEPPAQPWKPDEVPSALSLFGRGLLAVVTTPAKSFSFQRRILNALSTQPGLAGRAALALAPLAANLGAAAVPFVGSLMQPARQDADGGDLNEPATKVPRTSFNMAITPHRRVALKTVSLDEVRAVKKHFGVTVNDVVMALCATALRRWLIDHEELPEQALVAMVPVSIRTEAEKGAMGNKVSTMFASLATNLDDPVARLQAIHDSMAVAKEDFKAVPAELLSEYTQFATPALAARAARALARAKVAERINLPCNVVISNVPGPNYPLWSLGAKLVASYPVSTIADGVGLNITVMSYMGDLNFGLVACRELVPDLTNLAEYLGDALEELTKAATVAPAATPVPPPAAAATAAAAAASAAADSAPAAARQPAASALAAARQPAARKVSSAAKKAPRTAKASSSAAKASRTAKVASAGTAKKPSSASKKRGPATPDSSSGA